MFSKVLIANRGVIACRIARTLRKLGVGSVAVYSEADRNSVHVDQCDQAVLLGPAPTAQSYLNMERILEAARSTGAEAIHPGYGFSNHSPAFAETCEAGGMAFIGPTVEQMRTFSLEHKSRRLAELLHLPLLSGAGLSSSRSARHIEVQIFGDGDGNVLALGERDCSIQRGSEKVIEETPAPGLSDKTRKALASAALRLARAVQYRSAGTVEFLYDDQSDEFFFLDVSAGLQEAHGVTEEVTGIDLVEWMVRLAAKELPALSSLTPTPHGCSIQVHIHAEDPWKEFAQCSGRLTEVQFPGNARVETWVDAGTEITPHYDSLLAELVVSGDTREDAVGVLCAALDDSRITGVETNLPHLRQICAHPLFQEGSAITAFLRSVPYVSNAIDVLEPGTQTTVQDYPGRLGLWHVGVPPSGPLDALSFRMANRIVGNLMSAAGLEIAVSGPVLKFRAATTIAITGAEMGAVLDGVKVPLWAPIDVPAGSTLAFGAATEAGLRAYLAIRGGIHTPVYQGSKSTFILGKFGGITGRAVRAGDVLHIGSEYSDTTAPRIPAKDSVPRYSRHWDIGVLYGPHGAPDFFTEADIDAFFSARWKVHHNSDRTGVRLIGPKPEWARKDGGEAGLHPSNIHDNAYAVGSVDFTGDMPVILGPDGPSLGGFVCPATIVAAELWKTGQLRPSDTVTFVPMDLAAAERMVSAIERSIQTLEDPLPHLPAPCREPPVLSGRSPGIVCRADGDRSLLIEYGPNTLDLELRFRIHALEESLRAAKLPGMIDITPGIRSLQLHYDGAALSRDALLEAIEDADRSSNGANRASISSRIVHLPLSWDDPSTRRAIERYTQTVRPGAPWCPSNIEFIRRINGLESLDDVYRIVFGASYLVLGLGDVYLGAPVATPLDPRHRLVTTKYNPARTWTPENAVGIGGAYLCVYGMEGPGGYQFVGRTIQMWSTWRQTDSFEQGTPWLLRFFDQIRFYPVSAEELLELREDFPHGRARLRIEQSSFSLTAYKQFLESIQPESAAFQARRQAAFESERQRWVEAPQTLAVPRGCYSIPSPLSASVRKLTVEPGQRIAAGDRLLVLEAMKGDVVVVAPRPGVVESFQCKPGLGVDSGQTLLFVRADP